ASEQGSNIAATHVLKIMRKRCGRKRNGARIPEFKITERSKPNETISSHRHALADRRNARSSWHRQDNDGSEISKSSIHPDRGWLPEWANVCDSFASVIEALTWLGKETHNYQTLVIDSLDALEPLVQAALCADRGYASIEAPGFGKGYVELDKYWLDFLRGCNWLRRNRNINILMYRTTQIILLN